MHKNNSKTAAPKTQQKQDWNLTVFLNVAFTFILTTVLSAYYGVSVLVPLFQFLYCCRYAACDIYEQLAYSLSFSSSLHEHFTTV